MGTFCTQFEHTYNFDVKMATLSPSERLAFGGIFEQVIWYSPYPDEQAKIPHYRSEDQIREAVRNAIVLLGRRS